MAINPHFRLFSKIKRIFFTALLLYATTYVIVDHYQRFFASPRSKSQVDVLTFLDESGVYDRLQGGSLDAASSLSEYSIGSTGQEGNDEGLMESLRGGFAIPGRISRTGKSAKSPAADSNLRIRRDLVHSRRRARLAEVRPDDEESQKPLILEATSPDNDYEVDPYEEKTDASIFPDQTQAAFKLAEKLRRIRIHGWKFCPTLEGAVFDSFVYMNALNGSIAAKNPTHQDLVEIIEDEARRLFKHLNSQAHVDRRDLRRFSCVFAADGANGAVHLSEQRLLLSLDPVNYFPFLSIEPDSWRSDPDEAGTPQADQEAKDEKKTPLSPQIMMESEAELNAIEVLTPNTLATKSPEIIPRRKYKIAYQILVHQESSFENIKMLIDRLDTEHSFIIIHCDIKSPTLRWRIQQHLVNERLPKTRRNNIVLQRRNFGVIWGHISVVHAQIEGFFELLDLADWEYVINLSAYDYPLKSTDDIYTALKAKNDSSWIEYWSDPDGSAGRLTRPHIVLENYSGTYHPWDTGLRWWPFPNFKPYKHHQWMMLHRSFVEYLRTDSMALNLLAYMEHTWIPDESYFATVAVNSPEFKDKIISNSKRYIRFEGGWHPIWLTWNHRHEFLLGDKVDEGYFFIRKIDIGAQPRLIEWLHRKLFDLKPDAPCEIEDIGYRPRCFKEILTEAAQSSKDGSIIVIPVNQGFFDLAMNLWCSLRRLGMDSAVLFWAFDSDTHQRLLARNLLSLHNRGLFWGTADVQHWHKGAFSRMMRQKIILWRMLLENGISFWHLDADTVVANDFRSGTLHPDTDLHLAIDEGESIFRVLRERPVPNTCTGIMHLRNSQGSMALIDRLQKILNDTVWMEDQEAMNQMLRTELLEENSGVIVRGFEERQRAMLQVQKYRKQYDEQLRDRSFRDEDRIPVWDAGTKRLVKPNGDSVNADRKQAAAAAIHGKDEGTTDFATNGDSAIAKNTTVVRLLDQFGFISGHMYFRNRQAIPQGVLHKVIHVNSIENKVETMKAFRLWLLDNEGQCPFPQQPRQPPQRPPPPPPPQQRPPPVVQQPEPQQRIVPQPQHPAKQPQQPTIEEDIVESIPQQQNIPQPQQPPQPPQPPHPQPPQNQQPAQTPQQPLKKDAEKPPIVPRNNRDAEALGEDESEVDDKNDKIITGKESQASREDRDSEIDHDHDWKASMKRRTRHHQPPQVKVVESNAGLDNPGDAAGIAPPVDI
ncbi:Beta-1,3-galactosyl-O-glycosyl-glycoprotein beta-1,6-N-acetylglucosaminyltransferase 4 [Quaeritorhiza haematococci]|nr:Beta-1,3-galactosyl-O-glycosyl-glycoprotein beta-1,6-N-acetylglucosaminyltransferase 4 [Quaeritorhiza haematococci]